MRNRASEHALPRDLTCRVLQHDGAEVALLSFVPSHRARILTPAESEVALALVRGLSNAAIARERGAAVRTVANQVAAIVKKLGVSSRVQVAMVFSVADLG